MQKDCRYCSPEHICEVWCHCIRDQNSRTLVPHSTETSGRIPNVKQCYRQPRKHCLSVAAWFFSRLLLLYSSNPYTVQFMVCICCPPEFTDQTQVPNLPTQCTRSLQSTTTTKGQCAVVKWHALFEAAWERLHYPAVNF